MRVFVSALCSLILLTASQSYALTLSAKKLKKAGVKITNCPVFVGNLSTGLQSSVLKTRSLCVSNDAMRTKAAKSLKVKTLPLDGRFRVGEEFPSVENQQGDVQTLPFLVANYPALISYSVTQATYKSRFRIAVVNAETHKEVLTFFRSKGDVEGEIAWNQPGRYYFRMQAYGDSKDGSQPYYSVSMTFMDVYENYRVSKNDLKDAEVPVKGCPKQLIDIDSGSLYRLNKNVCFPVDGEDAGMLAAPFNTAQQIFLATSLDLGGTGDYISFPFRVNNPVSLNYSVIDPTNGKGKLDAYLIDLSTGKKSSIIDVKGNIQNTSTWINKPGDYYLWVATKPNDPEEKGEIDWTISVEGSH